MPWREYTVIDQREEFVKLALAPGVNLSELCRRFGVSRSNGHKWVERYLKEGREGLPIVRGDRIAARCGRWRRLKPAFCVFETRATTRGAGARSRT